MFTGRYVERGRAEDLSIAVDTRVRYVYDPERLFFDFYQRSGCAANEFEPR